MLYNKCTNFTSFYKSEPQNFQILQSSWHKNLKYYYYSVWSQTLNYHKDVIFLIYVSGKLAINIK